jgi:hypothetical protein
VKERRESSQDERRERAQERERRHRYWSISDGKRCIRRVPTCCCLYVFFSLLAFSLPLLTILLFLFSAAIFPPFVRICLFLQLCFSSLLVLQSSVAISSDQCALVRSVSFKHVFLTTDVWYSEVIAVLKLLIAVHNLARIHVFFADLRWLLLGWLLAAVCQMVTASTVLQPLSDGDKEAIAGYFVADADGFYGR